MKQKKRAPLGCAQRGQALVEFVAVALALVPLFLLVPLIAKYQDVAHSTQMAARYVAFEAMSHNDAVSSWKLETQLSDEVRRRFFSNPDAYIKTNDTAGNFRAHQNPFWRGLSDEPLVKKFESDVKVVFGSDNKPKHGMGFRSASDGAIFAPAASQLRLQSPGIYTANVSVALANLPSGIKSVEPFDQINLVVSRNTSLITDPWAAKNPEHAESRFGGDVAIFPGRTVQGLADGLGVLTNLIDHKSSPKIGRLEFWRDLVPEDRLRGSP
ncbi:MAG: hypothetical protein ACT4NV_09215 [Rhodoferax sp.]